MVGSEFEDGIVVAVEDVDSNQSTKGSIHYVEYEGVDGWTLMDEFGLGQNEAVNWLW